jgi:hypothetical protein
MQGAQGGNKAKRLAIAANAAAGRTHLSNGRQYLHLV